MAIILPAIRKVMPNIIASQLAGVQPMTGAAGSIFQLYGEMVSMEKKHYQHFLRLYNRRRDQRVDELVKQGYGYVSINPLNQSVAREWCRKNCKDGSFVFAGSRIYFAYDKDITRFSLSVS